MAKDLVKTEINVIDNKIGYVGGMNIGVDYLSQDKKIKPWRDTHLRIVGEAVSLLQVRFLQDFSYSDHNKISKKNKMSSSEIFKAVKYFEKNIKEKQNMLILYKLFLLVLIVIKKKLKEVI